MKTVEVLAKYLGEWPSFVAHIFQHPDDLNFYSRHYPLSLFLPGMISNAGLCALRGLPLCDDAGTKVSPEQWKEQKEKDKAARIDILRGAPLLPGDVVPGKEPLPPHIADAIAQAKIETLAHMLKERGAVSDADSKDMAYAINNAFDKLRF